MRSASVLASVPDGAGSPDGAPAQTDPFDGTRKARPRIQVQYRVSHQQKPEQRCAERLESFVKLHRRILDCS